MFQLKKVQGRGLAQAITKCDSFAPAQSMISECQGKALFAQMQTKVDAGALTMNTAGTHLSKDSVRQGMKLKKFMKWQGRHFWSQ